MVSEKSVEKQLKRIGFQKHGWGKGEVGELPHILLEDEEIYEAVNGVYEGGFALLIATNIRVLLIDKKPLNFLTVEDLRFDMINEMDYNHRLFGAHITITTGSKTLIFRSYNQPKLRKLIGHVQHCMAESKKQQSNHQQDQSEHLERINDQLQSYLKAQYEHQLELQKFQLAQQSGVPVPPAAPDPVKPAPELADYLFAQSLLAQHQAETGRNDLPLQVAPLEVARARQAPPQQAAQDTQLQEMYSDGLQEVFGKRQVVQATVPVQALPPQPQAVAATPVDVTSLNIAYSKLPMALRNRKFGRPSFHAHSQAEAPVATY